MPAPQSELNLFKAQHRRCEDLWRDFIEIRRDEYLPYIHRRKPQEVPESLSPFRYGVDIELPDLELEAGKIVATLMMHPTQIDAQVQSSRKTDKDNTEDIRIYSADSLRKQNEGRILDQGRSEGQTIYGLAWQRKLFHRLPEPDIEEPDPADIQAVATYLADREDYFRQGYKRETFETININPLEMMCWPIEKPTVVFQTSLVPYMEAYDIRNAKGQSMAEVARLVHLGGSEHDQADISGGQADKHVKLIIREACDPKTGKWTCTEYVCESGGDMFADGEIFNQYDLPFKHSSYVMCPAGNEMILEPDPHLRFRPLIYGQITDVQELNYWLTSLAAFAQKRMSDKGLYIDISSATPEQVMAWEGTGLGSVELVGQERRFVFKTPDPSSDEFFMAPTLKPIPNTLEEIIKWHIEKKYQDFQAHSLNRFLIGENFAETETGSATANRNAQQAAAIPFNKSIAKQDYATKQLMQMELDAIEYWGEDKKYYALTTGDEPFASNPVDPGTVVWVDAEKIRNTPYFLIATTKSETQEEKAINDAAADTGYEKRRLTREQWLKATGAEDPSKQAEMLDEDEMREAYKVRFQQIDMAMVDTILSAMADVDLSGLPMPNMQQEQEHVPATQPQGVSRGNLGPPPAGVQGGSADMGGYGQ